MKAIIAGDHYCVELIQQIQSILEESNVPFENVGTMDPEKKIALQTIIPAVAEKVRGSEDTFGVLACGTGAGVEIGANKFRKIRASLCTTPQQAEYARTYDNANVLCLSAWITKDPKEILGAWLKAQFDGSEKRTQMLKDFDTWS